MTNVLNPDAVCADCGNGYTNDGEWVMDVYACDQMQQYCLNCCGCEDHEGEKWYANKTIIDWDLNIYMPEMWDEEKDDSYYDPASWKIQVYAYRDGDHNEWDDPIALTAEEIVSIGFNNDNYFINQTDTWYGLAGFKLDYWSKLSDRLKMYFEALPKYWEDMATGNYGQRLNN